MLREDTNNRYLTSYRSYIIKEFLTRHEELKIIPFPLLPYTTHFAYSLDNKPFHTYRRKYKAVNQSVICYGYNIKVQINVISFDTSPRYIRISLPRILFDPYLETIVFSYFTYRRLLGNSKLKRYNTPDYDLDLKIFSDNPRWSNSVGLLLTASSSSLNAPITPRTVYRSIDSLNNVLILQKLRFQVTFKG